MISEKIVYQEEKQLFVNEILQIAEKSPAISEIVTARVIARVLCQEALFAYTLVQGVSTVTVFYLSVSSRNPLQTVQAQMDFTHKLPLYRLLPEDTVKTKLRVENLQLDLINPTTLEIKIIFHLQSRIANTHTPSIPTVSKDFFWTSAHYLN